MNTGCVLTPYSKSRGYGYVRIKGKLYLHHRLAYCNAHNIPIEAIAGKVVMHICDNPACVNPAHLRLGSKKDNTQDMMHKGRNGFRHKQGEQIGTSKLTEQDVLDIRAARMTQTQLATKYNVTQAAISAILLRKTWKHI